MHSEKMLEFCGYDQLNSTCFKYVLIDPKDFQYILDLVQNKGTFSADKIYLRPNFQAPLI